MFDRLTQKLNESFRHLTGKARFSDENMKSALTDVKKALLEADVAYDVVKEFLNRIREEAKGQMVSQNLSPAQALVKLIHQELVHLMGSVSSPLTYQAEPPVVILMAGLQGSGKTTTVAKLGRWIQNQDKKSVMVVSCDVYRPAAIDQLKVVAEAVGVDFFESDASQTPVAIAQAALTEARRSQKQVLIVDTAGRLHVDADMMAEIQQLHQILKPTETLFVVDGMTGQDAAKTAQAFHAVLPLTGVVVTKLDGDARGGAILSIRHLTGKPIKFIGVGEKTDALELFHPDRIASRILGMGDVLSLVETIEKTVDKKKAEQLAKKIQKGKGFDFEDFREQLLAMEKMGGMMGILDKLPGMGGLASAVQQKSGDAMLKKTMAVINSMTLKERRNPDLLEISARKRRIAKGSGTEIQDVNRILKQFEQMQKMMKKMGNPAMMSRMMQQMKGMMPPGSDQFLR